jgi:hypothetical protein
MKSSRSKAAQIVLGLILISSVGVLGYDNYKRAERISELETEVETYAAVASNYMTQYARCVKYVQIMHETCNCEGN